MPEAEKAKVEIHEVKKANVAMRASIPQESWFGELINQLDDPLSHLIMQGCLTPTALDGVLQNWVHQNGEAKRILWFFDETQYSHPQAFGFLVADLEEEGRYDEAEEFYKALKRERNRT